MSSALNQLIAQQQGPNVFGSALQGLAAANQEKQQAQENELNKQRITLGQRQLAMADAAEAEKVKAEGMRVMANTALALEKLPEDQRAATYVQMKAEAEKNWRGAHPWPAEYNSQVASMLNFAKSQVYGDELLKADLDKKPQGPVNVSAGSTLIDPASGKVIYQAPEKGMTEYERRSLALRERETAKPTENYRVVGGRLVDISSGKPVDVTPSGATSSKPLPVSLQKLEGEDVEAIQTSNTIQADLGEIKRQIDVGELDLGPGKNLWNSARNAAGMSTDESRKLSTLKASLERLRNDSLRLNKGVQTDGDAQRAWDELVKNINDPKLVSERLAEIQKINERGAALRAQSINKRRADNGVAPIDDFSQFEVAPAIGNGAKGKYKVGDVVDHNGQKYRVVGGDPNDPDVEPM